MAAAKRAKVIKDCSTCSGRCPRIDDRDVPLLDLFTSCDSQIRVSISGGFALDWPALSIVARDSGYVLDRDDWHAVRLMEDAFFSAIESMKPSTGRNNG
jgi:hypothetical protein